ncbi:glycerophosphodiester phosphodiesterase [soil metagenome]
MQIIGHRGAKGYQPENTLASIGAAIRLGVDMIEFDVHTIKTGEVVVMHDETVDRTTNGTGLLTDYALKDLRKLDAGNGEKVPLLTEVLDLIDRRIPVNIELKGEGTAKAVAKIIKHYVTKKGWSYRLLLVSSFNHTELEEFAQLMPDAHIGTLLRNKPTSYWVIAHDDNVLSTNLDAKFITRKNVREAHSHGLKVYVYTVNSKLQARHMRALKVDGIFTDYPDKVLLRPRFSHSKSIVASAIHR